MKDDKILISVAPVDAGEHKADPEEIAADVLECAKFGAGMVHLHVRKPDGSLTDDLTYLEKTISLIRKQSDIIIEASTGGVSDLTIHQRCAPLSCENVEAVSLNVGSVNLGEAVYQNPAKDVRYCVQEIVKSGKTPEVEVFELGMIYTAVSLKSLYGMKDPLLFSIVLGHGGAAPATLEALLAMRSFIPADMLWGITHAHRTNNEIIRQAVALGAKTVRVGFEDSHIIDNGELSKSNAPIVAETIRLVKALGKEPMTPSEARLFFNIK